MKSKTKNPKSKRIKKSVNSSKRSSSDFFSHRKSSYQKNLDNLKLFFSYPDFQKELPVIRKFLDIPPKGVPDKIEKIREWYDHMIKKSDEMMNSELFFKQEQQIQIRQKEIGSVMARKQMDLLYHSVPINYIRETAEFLTDKFNLPVHYADSIKSYIVSNRIEAPANNFSIGYSNPKSLKQMRHLEIKVCAELTDDDLKEIKQQIKHWIGKPLPRFQALKNVDNNLEIEQWFENRIKQDLVSGESYTTHAKEIAENLLGSEDKHRQVYEIPRQMRSLRKRRFGKQ